MGIGDAYYTKGCEELNKIIIFLVLGMWLFTGCSNQEVVMTARSDSSETGEALVTEQKEVGECEKETALIYVYVCGYVNYPGVYPLENGSRICDALALAGGISEEGKPEALNQAEHVEDGQTIYVPGINDIVTVTEESDGLVDINTADSSDLMTLPGIGESKADMIIQYREEHGAFETIEDLMKIPGIKEGVFNKIRDYIKVS